MINTVELAKNLTGGANSDSSTLNVNKFILNFEK